MSVMIETDNLARYFGSIKAVDGISFKVEKGEVLGFLGPNGAGKSTTMKMLTCFLTPSLGTAKVGGYDILEQSREVRESLGYLPENAPLYGEMEVGEFLSFISEIRGIEAQKRVAAIDRVVALCSLGEVFRQRIETLSKGYKRRVGLAQALLHDPEILILDEPTDGLDPNQKHEVRTLINSMARDKCIILSTHILEEVDAVCTRAVIIAHGKIVADASPDELRRRSPAYGAVRVCLETSPEGEVESNLRGISGVNKVQREDYTDGSLSFVLFPEEGAQIFQAVAREVETNNWALRDMRMETGHLDEVFREITQ